MGIIRRILSKTPFGLLAGQAAKGYTEIARTIQEPQPVLRGLGVVGKSAAEGLAEAAGANMGGGKVVAGTVPFVEAPFRAGARGAVTLGKSAWNWLRRQTGSPFEGLGFTEGLKKFGTSKAGAILSGVTAFEAGSLGYSAATGKPFDPFFGARTAKTIIGSAINLPAALIGGAFGYGGKIFGAMKGQPLPVPIMPTLPTIPQIPKGSIIGDIPAYTVGTPDIPTAFSFVSPQSGFAPSVNVGGGGGLPPELLLLLLGGAGGYLLGRKRKRKKYKRKKAKK